MKKIINYCLWLALVFVTLQACEKREETPEAPRVFRPTGLSASVNEVSVTLTWNAIPGIETYFVEVSQGDSLEFLTIIDRFLLSETTYKLEDLASAEIYSARVRSNSTDMEHDSQWATVYFEIAAENLFKGFWPRLTGLHQVAVNWAPGKAVTQLQFTPEGGGTPVVASISLSEADAGFCTVENIPNGNYRVEIYNDDILRGTTTVKVAGTRFLTAGESLSAAVAAAVSGDVIVLASGGTYETGNPNLPAGVSLTLYGADANERPVVNGKAFLPNEGASIHCENITFDGGNDGVTANTGVDYLCGGPTGVTNSMPLVSFENCYIRNYNRSIVRVQGDRIDQVKFNNCIFQNIGRNGQYSIIQTNSAGKIENVTMTNCTLWDVHGCVMYANGASETFTSFTLRNCTFYDVFATNSQSIFRGTDARAPVTSAVTDIIVSKLKVNDGTVRLWNIAAGVTPTTVANNWKTYGRNADDAGDCWVHADYAMEIQEYAGTADDLFIDAANGDFAIKDRNFSAAATAGDPRWR